MMSALQHEKVTGREKESFLKLWNCRERRIQINTEYFRSHPEEATLI